MQCSGRGASCRVAAPLSIPGSAIAERSTIEPSRAETMRCLAPRNTSVGSVANAARGFRKYSPGVRSRGLDSARVIGPRSDTSSPFRKPKLWEQPQGPERGRRPRHRRYWQSSLHLQHPRDAGWRRRTCRSRVGLPAGRGRWKKTVRILSDRRYNRLKGNCPRGLGTGRRRCLKIVTKILPCF